MTTISVHNKDSTAVPAAETKDCGPITLKQPESKTFRKSDRLLGQRGAPQLIDLKTSCFFSSSLEVMLSYMVLLFERVSRALSVKRALSFSVIVPVHVCLSFKAPALAAWRALVYPERAWLFKEGFFTLVLAQATSPRALSKFRHSIGD